LRKVLRRWVSNRLGAKEKLGRDLRIGLAVDDESRDLELALGERVDARSV
jgi:hypothetical protein